MHREPIRKGPLQTLTDGTLTETDARSMFEGMRWPNGLVCAFTDCGGSEIYRISVAEKTLASGRYVGPRELYKCKACRRQFSVTRGTIFEDSKIPLRIWLTTMFRMCASKKSVSARQIEREFGLSHRAAWFMCHRIRWAMADPNPTEFSGVVEADETYVGGKPRGPRKARMGFEGAQRKGAEHAKTRTPVFGMAERGGRVRAHVMKDVDAFNVMRAIEDNVDEKRTFLMTDEHRAYRWIQSKMPHDVIRHRSEYVRGDVHTQNIESFWAILKRGLIGTYHHVDAGYLNQYVNEYEFRHNTRTISDAERFRVLASQTNGRVDWYLGKQAKPVVDQRPDSPNDL